ncbi:MAG: response regulator [Rhodoplanes sp.]
MSSSDPRAGGRRILVVEDEFMVADYIVLTLEDLGYEVVGPVPTISEATAAIASAKLDAVLLDANLDGTSSAPIAAELARSRIPFVVVTGYINNFTGDNAALQDAPRLHKPFTPAELAAVLSNMIAVVRE